MKSVKEIIQQLSPRKSKVVALIEPAISRNRSRPFRELQFICLFQNDLFFLTAADCRGRVSDIDDRR